MSLNRKILVMDDDEMILTLVTSILELNGYSFDIAFDGNEAIEKYQQSMNEGCCFDIVIMDLTIPGGMGGKEAVLELLKIDPNAKCIVSSGYSGDAIMTNFNDYGFKGVLSKPFVVSELLVVLDNLL